MKREIQKHLVLTVPIMGTMGEIADLICEAEKDIPEGYVFTASWRDGRDLCMRFSPS